MKQLLLAGAGFVALAASQPAHAAYILDVAQVGSDVVATGSGTIDTAGLSLGFTGRVATPLIPEEGLIIIGGNNEIPGEVTGLADGYSGYTGPATFGNGGGATGATSGSGDIVGIGGGRQGLFVPAGYVSDTSLMSMATYAGQSFSSLGAIPGTYVWTWGTGPNADSFTLNIGAAPPPAVPEPASLTLLGVGLLGLTVVRMRRS